MSRKSAGMSFLPFTVYEVAPEFSRIHSFAVFIDQSDIDAHESGAVQRGFDRQGLVGRNFAGKFLVVIAAAEITQEIFAGFC